MHHLHIGVTTNYQEITLDIVETAMQRLALGEAAKEVKLAKERYVKTTGDTTALIEVQKSAMMLAKQKVRGGGG